jgi:hypothetical protein
MQNRAGKIEAKRVQYVQKWQKMRPKCVCVVNIGIDLEGGGEIQFSTEMGKDMVFGTII